MKKSLNYNITDAMIASDEWESFDYNLRLQIEELATIDYDNQPEKWKENTLARSYLYHAEKLLQETGAMNDYTINTINELKKVIMKYEGMNIFLQTLRLATIVTRAGIIPEMAECGENYRKEQSRKASIKRTTGGLTPDERQKRNESIVEHYKKAREKNRDITLNSFAKQHADKYRLKPTRIKQIITSSLDT